RERAWASGGAAPVSALYGRRAGAGVRRVDSRAPTLSGRDHAAANHIVAGWPMASPLLPVWAGRAATDGCHRGLTSRPTSRTALSDAVWVGRPSCHPGPPQIVHVCVAHPAAMPAPRT